MFSRLRTGLIIDNNEILTSKRHAGATLDQAASELDQAASEKA